MYSVLDFIESLAFPKVQLGGLITIYPKNRKSNISERRLISALRRTAPGAIPHPPPMVNCITIRQKFRFVAGASLSFSLYSNYLGFLLCVGKVLNECCVARVCHAYPEHRDLAAYYGDRVVRPFLLS